MRRATAAFLVVAVFATAGLSAAARKFGKPITLTVELSGLGNPRTFAEPSLRVDESDFKLYDPDLKSDTKIDEARIRVRKSYTLDRTRENLLEAALWTRALTEAEMSALVGRGLHTVRDYHQRVGDYLGVDGDDIPADLIRAAREMDKK